MYLLDKHSTIKAIFYIIVTIIIIVGLFGGLFVDESIAVRTIESVGLTDYKITGREWLLVSFQGCAREDFVKFDFTATSAQGKKISGFVCAGMFKAGTLRIP